MADLSRFAQGLPDRQEAKVVARCDACNGELYSGEEVYLFADTGSILHKEEECLMEYLYHIQGQLATGLVEEFLD